MADTKDSKSVESKDKVEKEKVVKVLAVPEGTKVMCDDGVERVVISRESAIAKGMKKDEVYGEVYAVNRYFTGEKCANGHMAERKVKGYVCVVCARGRMKDRKKKRMAADPEYKKKLADARKAKHKARYADDPAYREKVLAKGKERRAAAAKVRAESPEGVKKAAEKEAAASKKAAAAKAKEEAAKIKAKSAAVDTVKAGKAKVADKK